MYRLPRILFLTGILLLTGFGAIQAKNQPAVTFLSLLEEMISLQSLYLPPAYSVHLITSPNAEAAPGAEAAAPRPEGDWFVIAELKGPGAISRIWSPNPSGLIRIFLDDGSTPMLQVSFPDLFGGQIKPFQKPFIRSSSQIPGAHWSYIPIPYAKFCKIALQTLCDYQIEYLTFPDHQPVQPFPYPLSKEDGRKFSEIVKAVKTIPQPPYKEGNDLKTYTVTYSLAAGERIVLATFAGPAVLRGLQIRWPDSRVETGRWLWLNGYWDQEKSPSLCVPLHDFFGGTVQTLAAGRDKHGWRYFYLPMPFQKEARFELKNNSANQMYKIEAKFAVQTVTTLPSPPRTLHALWTRENETPVRNLQWNSKNYGLIGDPNDNYVVLSTRGKGHLVGLGLHAVPLPDSEVSLFLDQSSPPLPFPPASLLGFFDQAGKAQTVNWLFAGGTDSRTLGNSLFRLFVPAPVAFEQGVLAAFTHGPANSLRVDYAGTAFWYQEEPHSAYPWPPPAGGGRFRVSPPVQPVIEFHPTEEVTVLPLEAESLPAETVGGVYDPQDMLPYGPDWSGNQQLRFEAGQPGGALILESPEPAFSGWYYLECVMTSGPWGAVTEIQVEDQIIHPGVDLYSPDIVPKKVVSESPTFLHAAKEPKVHFVARKKNAKSSGYVIGVDCFQWKPVVQTPNSLEILGPLNPISDPADLVTSATPRVIQSRDGDPLILGSLLPGVDSPPTTEILPDSSKDRFPLGSLLTDANLEQGLFFITWTIHAGRNGIYRFEIEPADAEPFLFKEESGRIVTWIHRLLINDILLTGKDIVRYDPAAKQVLPLRYRVPLQAGDNRLSWLMNSKKDTWITPRLYGVQAGS
ncbi:MAG: DUF2961 domain-containing protein [bacterium]